MFEHRRPASPEEIAQLIASFDATGLPELEDAEVSEIATLSELGAMHTVLAIPDPRPGADSFYTVAELAPGWNAGGGSPTGRPRSPSTRSPVVLVTEVDHLAYLGCRWGPLPRVVLRID